MERLGTVCGTASYVGMQEKSRRRQYPGVFAGGVLGPVVAVALAGCSWFGTDVSPPEAVCPPVLLLDGAERMVAYEPGRDPGPSAVRYVAAIGDLAAECQAEEGQVTIDLRLSVLAEAGPLHRGEPVALEVFVAAVSNERILGRHTLDVQLALDRTDGRGGRLEQVTLQLPGPFRDERIFVGFELDRAAARGQVQRLLQ
jgi:hypothetical protein